MSWLAQGVAALVPEGLIRSLLVDGIIAAAGNVLIFLPPIALLFFGITILEESGYMARAAFLLDRFMRKVGLHGKSFIPLMSGFACAVPAIMSARTIESARDRLVVIFVTPFMSCSARLPIYVLAVAAMFSSTPLLFGALSFGGVLITIMYLLGFVAAIFTVWLLKKTVLKAPTPVFLLELPSYQVPDPREVLLRVLERCRAFVVCTGPIILALSVVMWALLTFPRQELGEEPAALEHSFAGRIGSAIEPAIEPLGFDWRIGIGLVASFAAREVLVSTLAQVFGHADPADDAPALSHTLRRAVNPRTGKPVFTPLVGVSLMVFFVLAMQCLSTFATVRRETNSWRWPLLQLAYMNTLAYLASLTVYQLGLSLGLGT